MKPAPLKYNIKNRLERLTRAEHTKTFAKLKTAVLPFTTRTFYRWMEIKQDNPVEIPYTQLSTISKTFGCSIEELINPVIPKKP